jgi:hypothetical protein
LGAGSKQIFNCVGRLTYGRCKRKTSIITIEEDGAGVPTK